MKKRNLTIVIIAVFCVMFAGAVMLLAGKKEVREDAGDYAEASSDRNGAIPDSDIDYSGLGNEQGNIENPGGKQTYLTERKLYDTGDQV